MTRYITGRSADGQGRRAAGRRIAVRGPRAGPGGEVTRLALPVARAIPVPVAIAVAVWDPGVWTAAATGLLILAYLLALDLLTTRDASRVAAAAATLGTAAAATALIAALFALPPIPAWPLVLIGLAATAIAHALTVHREPRS